MNPHLKLNLSQFFFWKAILAGAALALVPSAQAQDHGHLYISAYSQQAGAQLYFDNGGIFELASGYVKTLTLNTSLPDLGAAEIGWLPTSMLCDRSGPCTREACASR